MKLPRRRFWRLAIYLATLLLVVVAADLVLVHVRRTIEPGYGVTRITAPKLPDGRIDYLLALDEHFGRGVTPENNAAVPILLALGRQALADNQPPDGITSRLGMSPLPEKGDYFVTLANFDGGGGGGGTQEDDLFEQLNASRPRWPITIGPVTRRWLEANRRPLDAVADAVRRPRFFIPFFGGNRPETLLEVRLAHVVPMQDAGRALIARAAGALGARDAAGFRADVLAAHRLARVLGQGPTLVERMGAARIEGTACWLVRLAAAAGAIPAADARALAAELSDLPDLPSGAESVDNCERYLVLDVLQWMAAGGPRNVASFFANAAYMNDPGPRREPSAIESVGSRFLPIPYERCMEVMNGYYDGAVVALRQPDWAGRHDAMLRWAGEVDRRVGDHDLTILLTADWPAAILLPAFGRVATVSETARAERRLAIVSLALLAHRAEHGGYPASLAELRAAYLPAVPNDPFADTPFRYVRTGEGYRLYSVGPNGKDDGGGATTRPVADDLGVTAPPPPAM